MILIGEAYWRRMYAEHHPDPRASHAATPAHAYATIAAYERVGWLAGKKTPIKPKLAPRKSFPSSGSANWNPKLRNCANS